MQRSKSRKKLFVNLLLSLSLVVGFVALPNPFPSFAATHEVTWDDNGATEASSGRQTSYNTATPSVWEVPTTPPTRDGYTFVTWTTSPTGGTEWSFDNKPTGPTTYYAKWEAGAIYWDEGGAEFWDDEGTGVTTGSGGTGVNYAGWPIAELRSVVRNGFVFDGWFDAPTGGTEVTTSYVPSASSGDVTFYARWLGDPLVVTYQTQGGSSIDTGATRVGDTILTSPGTPSLFDHDFKGWYTSPIGGQPISFPYWHAQRGDFELFAQWRKAVYAITWDDNSANEDGASFHGSSSYSSGSAVANIAVGGLKDGYDFGGWFTSITGGTEVSEGYTPAEASGPLTFYARWIPNGDNVVWDGNGATTPSSGGTVRYNSGSSIENIPTTDPERLGYEFAGWFTSPTDGVEVTDNSYTPLAPYNQVTFYARWIEDDPFVVTWDDQGATTPSSGGSTGYAPGTSLTFPTTNPQKTGHTFVGWFPAPDSGARLSELTPEDPYGDVTLYAHWNPTRSSLIGTWAWSELSTAGTRKWHGLAASADGSKLFAGVDDGGSLYRSTDFGVNWSVVFGTSSRNWFSIATSIDGTKVAAVDRGGDIWTSADSGTTWTARRVGGQVHDWASIASNSDGTKLVAVATNGSENGFIYTSTDGGVSWSSNLAPEGNNQFTGVASSSDGTHLAATTWSSGIYTSSDSGQTWTLRSLPVPDEESLTYLQSVASSADGSRLVTGSRPATGDNGGIIFTSADYGVSWTSFDQTGDDYISFVSNGDGSRLAASVYGQQGVSTSDDFGVTWSFHAVGTQGEVPIASNIDGSLLFVGGYNGNLWTGKIPNARVVAALPLSTSLSITAGENTPATELSFPATAAAVAMTLTPIDNPVDDASTPFIVPEATIFDISVTNISGEVEVCVDGGSPIRLWHFTDEAWVDITERQTATQTCGLTTSFSPFATGIENPGGVGSEDSSAGENAHDSSLEGLNLATTSPGASATKPRTSVTDVEGQPEETDEEAAADKDTVAAPAETVGSAGDLLLPLAAGFLVIAVVGSALVVRGRRGNSGNW